MRQTNLLRSCFGRLRVLNILFLATSFLTLLPHKLMANHIQRTALSSSKCLPQEYSQIHSINEKIDASKEFYGRGLSLVEKGDLEGALDCTKQAILLSPDYWLEEIREQIRNNKNLKDGRKYSQDAIDSLYNRDFNAAQGAFQKAQRSFTSAKNPDGTACAKLINKFFKDGERVSDKVSENSTFLEFKREQRCFPLYRSTPPKKP